MGFACGKQVFPSHWARITKKTGTDFEPSCIAQGRWYIPLCPRPLVALNHLLVWIILFWIELVLAQGGVLDIPLCVSYSLCTIIVYYFVYISSIEIFPVFILLRKDKIDSLRHGAILDIIPKYYLDRAQPALHRS